MKKELLAHFYERSDLLKSVGGFTGVNSKFVAKYNFKVSNNIEDIENSIEINSTDDLEKAVKEYYSETDTSHEGRITYAKNFNKDDKMYVTLVLF